MFTRQSQRSSTATPQRWTSRAITPAHHPSHSYQSLPQPTKISSPATWPRQTVSRSITASFRHGSTHHQTSHPPLPQSHAGYDGTTHTELSRLSSRPYSVRASDPSDFASAWEENIVPLLTKILQHYASDFAVDVHTFPEMASSEAAAVPRVIYITLQQPNPSFEGGSPKGLEKQLQLEQAIRSELSHVVPERFAPVYVKFRTGEGLWRSNWWYVTFLFFYLLLGWGVVGRVGGPWVR